MGRACDQAKEEGATLAKVAPTGAAGMEESTPTVAKSKPAMSLCPQRAAA